MKQLLIYTIFAITVMSCVKKQIKQYPYTVIIESTELNFDGSRLQSESKEDTVLAENDTIGYYKALGKVLALKLTKDRFNGSMGKVKGYTVTDSLGNDLNISLDIKVIDSLKNDYYKLNKRYVGAFNF